MSKVVGAHAVSVADYFSRRTPDRDPEIGRGPGDAPVLFEPVHLVRLEAVPTPGVTHPRYQVVR